MTKMDQVKVEIEKLRAFLHGAHLATSEDEASGCFHHAFHQVDDILKIFERNDEYARSTGKCVHEFDIAYCDSTTTIKCKKCGDFIDESR